MPVAPSVLPPAPPPAVAVDLIEMALTTWNDPAKRNTYEMAALADLAVAVELRELRRLYLLQLKKAGI